MILKPSRGSNKNLVEECKVLVHELDLDVLCVRTILV